MSYSLLFILPSIHLPLKQLIFVSCSIKGEEPSCSLTHDAAQLSSLHSGQEYKPQITLRLTHLDSISESHKATVDRDRSAKISISLPNVSTKIKVPPFLVCGIASLAELPLLPADGQALNVN